MGRGWIVAAPRPPAIAETEKVGKLKVLTRSAPQRGRAVWTCQCDCGRILDVLDQSLRFRRRISCGCVPLADSQRRDVIRHRVKRGWSQEDAMTKPTHRAP